MILLPGESRTLAPESGKSSQVAERRRDVPTCTYRYSDRGYDRTATFPIDPKDDLSGVVASASSGPLRDYQDKLKAIQLRERGLSKTEIAEKVGRSEHWVKRWWREHPATLERPAGANDVVLQKASLSSFRDLDIRRGFLDDTSTYELLEKNVAWRQAKVVARDQNTGELALRYNERGETINAGRQVADYSGGLDFLDKVLQKVFSQMDIRDPQARVFMNYYADGQEKTGVHRHDFWTCLLSFGAPRILTVDNKPFLLRDRDLIVFGTQNHGVPVMPEISKGRISLVIFFYPDADNLERQWQTITEDDDEKPSATAQVLSTGLDKGFHAGLLYGEAPQSETLSQVLDPGAPKRELLKSPNSELSFGSHNGQRASTSLVIFSIASGSAGYTGEGVQADERGFFKMLLSGEVRMLFDLRFPSPRQGDWSEPATLKRSCAARAVAYRCYPLGRREAGGVTGHLRSEEGQEVLRRLVVAAREERTAFLSFDSDWTKPGFRSEVADWLMSGTFGSGIGVSHIMPNGLQDHIARCPQPVPSAQSAPKELSQTEPSPAKTVVAPSASDTDGQPTAPAQRVNRWARRRAEG